MTAHDDAQFVAGYHVLRAAYKYQGHHSDDTAGELDDACAAWLTTRGIDVEHGIFKADDHTPPALVYDLVAAARDRLVYGYCVAHARYDADHREFPAYFAARDALIAYDDTHPGDEVSG